MTKPERVPKDALIVSVSQALTKKRCTRLWYFDKVARLPRIKKDSQNFGTCLHAVAERYLSANANGTVPSDTRDTPLNGQPPGEPVNLYPAGWQMGLAQVDQEVVKWLIAEGIKDGILMRIPEGRVEHEFWERVAKGVWIVGYVDYMNWTQIQDHKSSTGTKWFETKESLKSDFQLAIYGYALNIDRARTARAPLLTFMVQHNQFCRGKGGKYPVKKSVRKTESVISSETMEKAWKELEAASEEMLVLKAAGVVEDFETIPGPHEPGACTKYNGCSMAGICTKIETIAEYTARAELSGGNNKHEKYPGLPKESPMSLRDKIANNAKAAIAAADTTPKATEVEVEGVLDFVGLEVPWAWSECDACEGDGFNTKGNPCRLCVGELPKDSDLHPDFYIIDSDDEGNRTITKLEKETPKTKPRTAVKKTLSSRDKTAQRAALKEKANEAMEPATARVKGEADDASESAKALASKHAEDQDEKRELEDIGLERVGISEDEYADIDKGRKGLTIIINATMDRGTASGTFHLDRLFRVCVAKLEEDQGESFVKMNTWARRDALSTMARLIVDKCGNGTIIASDVHPGTDIHSFCAAITAHCKTVIRGVGQ